MMKFKGLQFVASITADLTGEFDSLEEKIAANKSGEDNARELQNDYCHLGSLIQGLEYMAEFIADEDDEKELEEVLKDLRNQRDAYYPRIASIAYTQRLGKEVNITVMNHADGTKEYNVCIGFHCNVATFDSTEKVKEYIKILEKSRTDKE